VSRLLIKNATIFTGTVDVLTDCVITVEDQLITSIVPTAEHFGEDAAYDAAGMFVMPGLIDAHTHLTLHREAPERPEFHPATPFLSVRAAAEQLAAGVTTVRDVGGNCHVDIELRDAIDRGDVPGPRILAAGRPIAATGGHIHYFCHEADGPAEMQKAVRAEIKAGADLIKIMLTGGSANVDEQPSRLQLQPDEVIAAVTEAREASRPVAVHAHTSRAVRLAAQAGASSVEHGALLDDDGIEALLETGCVLVPTHAVYKSMAADDRHPEQAASVAKLLETKQLVLAKAIQAGARIGVGTDSGRHFPQGRIADEMQALVEAGMSVDAVLRAATSGNAQLLGIDLQTGTLEKGKRADILILGRDPRVDMSALKDIRRVYSAGQLAWDRVKEGADPL
jgi:imidazolonepropionase-like amidohydrolase